MKISLAMKTIMATIQTMLMDATRAVTGMWIPIRIPAGLKETETIPTREEATIMKDKDIMPEITIVLPALTAAIIIILHIIQITAMAIIGVVAMIINLTEIIAAAIPIMIDGPLILMHILKRQGVVAGKTAEDSFHIYYRITRVVFN